MTCPPEPSLVSPPAPGGKPPSAFGHPLELIAFFRRYPRSWWRDLIYTLIWSLGFTVMMVATVLVFTKPESIWRFVWQSSVISLCIGYSIHFMFDLAHRTFGARLLSWPTARRTMLGFALSMVGAFVGYIIGFGLLKRDFIALISREPRYLVSMLFFTTLTCVILIMFFIGRERATKVERDLAAERARVAESDRRALDAQLRMLQAQIEPHFLYNTLANVVGLIDPAPDKAKQMLVDFIAYLRQSLAATRAEAATLGGELALVESYLHILAVRMGERMRFRIEVASDLRALPFPPMLLQPLVENAVKHGLEPKVEGGEIVIAAERTSHQLRVEVSDTGLGFAAIGANPVPSRGTGVGLANLRERLQALFSGDGRLVLTENTPCGVRAVIEVPLPTLVSEQSEVQA